MKNQKILIIDDEPDIRTLVRYNLEQDGYTVFEASNGEDGLLLASAHRPDLILLDVMMPGMDGVEVCEKLRKNNSLSHTMICFLTARGEDYSQIAGFEAGADDYITKPIRPKLLVSRIAALLRRQDKTLATLPTVPLEIAEQSIKLDREKYIVTKDGKAITLPRKEFELLSLLMSVPERVFHRETIMSEVWGNEVVVGDRTIDVHIRKLREKLGEKHIITVKGVGYKFEY